ncbi:MAG TPA: hypothetical protein VMB51_01925 [Solirubrobacteraceae bacterium]|nr:hypothetical protein [Solirubrobacteraceae bacterium]
MPARAQHLRKAIATLVAGGALIAAGVAVALTHAPPRVVLVGAPGIKAVNERGASPLAATVGDATICQAGETLPRSATSVRLSIWGFLGARVHVSAWEGSRLLTQGRHDADWTSDSVTVPVTPLARTAYNVKLCFALAPNSEPLDLLGTRTPGGFATIVQPGPSGPEKHLLPGRVGIEYLAAGTGSWWSRLPEVAQHVGLGRAFAGTWITLLIVALMIAAAALAVRLMLRELP